MFCAKCGSASNELSANFCRECGAELGNRAVVARSKGSLVQPSKSANLMKPKAKDPDELLSDGIGGVIMGDGFFMVAVILSATHSSVSSLLWLFLLIPAFFFFGKGFADVLHAKRILRRLKENELSATQSKAELPPPRVSVVDVLQQAVSGELLGVSSVTERTTRSLES